MLVQVKENQPSLLRIIERISRTDTALSSSESFDDKKRSREESRKVDVFDASPTLENTDWDGLIVRVIKVTRATLVRRAKDRSWELRFDISFYVCSAPITARKGLLDELSGWVRCFWVVGLLLNPVGRAFPVDVTGGGQGRAL